MKRSRREVAGWMLLCVFACSQIGCGQTDQDRREAVKENLEILGKALDHYENEQRASAANNTIEAAEVESNPEP